MVRNFKFFFLFFLIGSSSADELSIDYENGIDQAFLIKECENTIRPNAIRCVFSTNKINNQVVRIKAYSLQMTLWNNKKQVWKESIPNGDIDSDESYKHLIISPKPFNSIRIGHHSIPAVESKQ